MTPKRRLFLVFAYAAATLFGLTFLAGITWSLFPIFGNTLPHHLAEWSGVSFKYSALLISSLLGVLCVGFFAVGALIQSISMDAEADW